MGIGRKFLGLQCAGLGIAVGVVAAHGAFAEDEASSAITLDVPVISLEFRPITSTGAPAAPSVGVGSTIRLGLFAVGVPDGTTLSGAQIVFTWEPAYLQLSGLDSMGGASLLVSGFPVSGSGGLNEVSPPQDGDGFYIALANLGTPIPATAGGTLLTTFLFEGVADAPPTTDVSILPSGGSPVQFSKVLDGTTPNFEVTGDLTGVTIRVATCVGDLDGDADTDVFDFAIFAPSFGSTGLTPFTGGDLDGDGDVDVFDFGLFAPDFGCGTY
jgi:hypothetical protein